MTAPPALGDRSDGRPVSPPEPARGSGHDVKSEPGTTQQQAAAPAGGGQPRKTDGDSAAARPPASAPATAESLTVQDNDPTQGNRVVSRAPPQARPAPKPAPPPSTAGSDVAPPPQQATLPTPEAPRAPVRPRIVSAPVATQPRIVRAEVDSTLELRGPRGEVLATTHLRAGATYTVPEHVGYVLAPVER
jgi:hypothetical protein